MAESIQDLREELYNMIFPTKLRLTDQEELYRRKAQMRHAYRILVGIP